MSWDAGTATSNRKMCNNEAVDLTAWRLSFTRYSCLSGYVSFLTAALTAGVKVLNREQPWFETQ